MKPPPTKPPPPIPPPTIRFLRQKQGSPFPSYHSNNENVPPIYRDAFLDLQQPELYNGNKNKPESQSSLFWDTYKPDDGHPEPSYNIYQSGERVVLRPKPSSITTPPVPMPHHESPGYHEQHRLSFTHSNYYLLPPPTSEFVWSINAPQWPEAPRPPDMESNHFINFAIKQELEEPYEQEFEPVAEVVESVAQEIARLEQKSPIVVPIVGKRKCGRSRKVAAEPPKQPTSPMFTEPQKQPTNLMCTEPKKRGRPRKHPVSKPPPKFIMPNGEPRKRGRPPKNGPKRSHAPKTPLPIEPRKRGRPPKNGPKRSRAPKTPLPKEPRKRGRPPKNGPKRSHAPKTPVPKEPRKRGRPPKKVKKRSRVSKTPLPTEPRKRGRPRKNPLSKKSKPQCDPGTSTPTT